MVQGGAAGPGFHSRGTAGGYRDHRAARLPAGAYIEKRAGICPLGDVSEQSPANCRGALPLCG